MKRTSASLAHPVRRRVILDGPLRALRGGMPAKLMRGRARCCSARDSSRPAALAEKRKPTTPGDHPPLGAGRAARQAASLAAQPSNHPSSDVRLSDAAEELSRVSKESRKFDTATLPILREVDRLEVVLTVRNLLPVPAKERGGSAHSDRRGVSGRASRVHEPRITDHRQPVRACDNLAQVQEKSQLH